MTAANVEPALVEAARRGDTAAREVLLDRALPLILQWCARLGGPRVDAEDAAHDVGVVLLTRLTELREPDRFGAWLFGVTRRVLAQHRRTAWLKRWVPGFGTERVEGDADPLRDAEISETTRRVQAALEDLSEPHREALVLFDLEERTESEVAELLDIPLGTARSRLRAAREAFRRAARKHHLHAEVVALPMGGRGDA